jgi:protein involved in polysaccharide export with SLBB domain
MSVCFLGFARSVRVAAVMAAGLLLLCVLPMRAGEAQTAASPKSGIPIEAEAQGPAPVPNAGAGTNAPKPGAPADQAKTGRIDNMEALDDHYKLRIGDRVSFRIVEGDEPPSQLTVTDSGELEIPYVGLCAVVGKSCQELAHALKVELEKEYYYKATVIIAITQFARSQGKVYIVGPVRSPGLEEIPSDEVLTLSKAILRVGGFMDYADKRKVRVTRKSSVPGGKDEVFIVDVEEVLRKGDRLADMPLQDQDLIFVPEKLVKF